MEEFSESFELLKKNEEEKRDLERELSITTEDRTRLEEEIYHRDNDRTTLVKEIDRKNLELLSMQVSILKPIRYIQTIFEKRHLKQEIEQQYQSKLDLDRIIQSLKLDSKTKGEKIRDLEGRINATQNSILHTNSQRSNGLELFEGTWYKKEEIEPLKKVRLGLEDNFGNMTPFDFEHFIAKLLTEMGYKTQVTKKTGDYGVDIIAIKNGTRTAVQCKKNHEDNFVGNRQIAQLLGSFQFYNADRGIFVTTSYFSKPAIQQANGASVDLWNKDTIHGLVEKYLLKKDVHEIFDAIEQAKRKEIEKAEEQKNTIIKKKLEKNRRREAKRAKLEEKRKIEAEKRICPICHGMKMKTRKYCSKCKKEGRRENKHKGFFNW